MMMIIVLFIQYKNGENINMEDYQEDDDDDDENDNRYDDEDEEDDFKISAADRRAANALGVNDSSKKIEVEGQSSVGAGTSGVTDGTTGSAPTAQPAATGRSARSSRKAVTSKQDLEGAANGR